MLRLYETGRFRDSGIESEGVSMLAKHRPRSGTRREDMPGRNLSKFSSKGLA